MSLRLLNRLKLENLNKTRNHLSINPDVKTIRPFFTWLNKIFNQIDQERLNKFGPERVCTEWLLRNGAQVKWIGFDKFARDYNSLPKADTELHIVEVDASSSSISHYGFGHFIGCNHISKVILHDCVYIEDEACKQLMHLKNSLVNLQLSLCGNITDEGIRYLKELSNLQELVLFDLYYVKEKKALVQELQAHLPKCHIAFDDILGWHFDEKVKLKNDKTKSK